MLTEIGLHLPPWMVELHPDLRAMGAANARPLTEFIQLPLILQHHTTRAGHGAAVDHDVPRQQQARTAFGPGLIQAQQLGRRPLRHVSKVLFHCCLGNTIRDNAAVGQLQSFECAHRRLRGDRSNKPKVKVSFKVNSPE